jgi:hypothetical protein
MTCFRKKRGEFLKKKKRGVFEEKKPGETHASMTLTEAPPREPLRRRVRGESL